VTHRIWIRHAAGVVAGKQFRKGARVFDIVTVHDPDETARYLVCRVKEA
jgi:SPP1 family predicted phage head-tail adaptor